jgi:hypothetical protein
MRKFFAPLITALLVIVTLIACGDRKPDEITSVEQMPPALRKSVAVSIQSPGLEVPQRAMISWSNRKGGVLGEAANNPALEGLLRAAIVKTMDQQAYQFTDHADQAFFQISYVLALEKDLSDQDLEKYFGLSLGLAGDKGFEQGTLVIDLQDQQGNSMWRGALQANVSSGLSEELRIARLNGAVETLLTNFFRLKAQ